MAEFSADDFDEVARVMAYERGLSAGAAGMERSAPSDCRKVAAWYLGYDEGARLAKKEAGS